MALVAAHLLFWFTASLEEAVFAGALVPARILGDVPAGLIPVWLTPVSSAFLHANLLHLGFNTLLLVYCGATVERVWGAARLCWMLLAGCYGAAAVQVAFDPHAMSPVIGASGAVSALIASYALLHPSPRVAAIGPFSPSTVQAAWLFVAWVALNVLQGVAFGTIGLALAVGAHIGGFAVGLLLTSRFEKRGPTN